MSNFHTPVLLKEVIDLLQIKKNGKYIDATLGGGGHTGKILELGGEVLGIDVDEDAINSLKNEIKNKNNDIWKNLTIAKGNFREIDKIARLNKFEKADGIIFDLGVSSYQIDNPERGFSFLKDGPLDMRMDKNLSVRARDLINILTKGELYKIFYKLGEDRRSWAISGSIVKSRGIEPIETTLDLARAVEKAYGIKGESNDFTRALVNKRIFQALRMVVNSELENLEEGLNKTIDLLKDKGRVLVISFHSLEDRIVKQKFVELESKNMGKIITKKPITAEDSETELNSRSKSAKLRVFEKN